MAKVKPKNLELDGLPCLEAPCYRCEGRGHKLIDIEGDPELRREPCDRCEETGYVLTEFGDRVFAMMQHQFRRLLPELRITRE